MLGCECKLSLPSSSAVLPLQEMLFAWKCVFFAGRVSSDRCVFPLCVEAEACNDYAKSATCDSIVRY